MRAILIAAVASTMLGCVGRDQNMPVGAATFVLNVVPPPASTTPSMFGAVTARVTAASDGHRTSVTIASESGAPGSPSILAGTWVRVVTRTTDDSVDLGASVPPFLAAMIPRPAGDSAPKGYRLRFKPPDTDSITRSDSSLNDATTAIPLRTNRVVAGLTCENWQVTSVKDTMYVCLTTGTPASAALMNWIGASVHLSPRAAARLSQLFGGRRLIPLRIASRDSSMVIELASVTAGQPPAELFDIPKSFVAVDSGLMKSITGSMPPGLRPRKP